MKHGFVIVLLLYAANLAHGDTCQAASSLPDGQTKIGSGSATVHYDGITTAKGGQAVYVKIKNENVLGVAYELTIVENVSPGVEICTYKALLPPRTSAILSGALFADPPIPWKVTVSVGEQSDAGVLTYEVYSQTDSKNTSKNKSKKK